MRRTLFGVFSVLVAAGCSGGGAGTIGQGPSGTAGPAPEGQPTETPPASTEGVTLPKSVTSRLAQDLTVTEVALFQGVKATLAKDGAKVAAGVPLVATRDALVRAYVKPAAGYKARELKAVLSVVDGDDKPLKALTDTKTLKSASTDASLASTFNFRVPGDSLPLGAKFSVAITDEAADEVKDGVDSEARYPADGSLASFGLVSAGPSLRIVIVPVKYTADGSGRLPDTSQTQLDINRDALWSQYPIPSVDITVRSAPFTWSKPVKGNGTGWGELLQAMADLREQDGADDDVYYWGAFSAASSKQAFCGGGCVAGLSTLVSDPRNAYFRASIGMGYGGADSAGTMVHEIGHAHGRSHAPCSDFGSIDGVDPSFPHQGGALGAWGYDLTKDKLISPSSAADFMGYCEPTWVSDYTYKGLFTRLATVNKGKPLAPTITPGSNTGNGARGVRGAQFQFVTLGADGPSAFGSVVTIKAPPSGEAREVQLLDEAGKVLRTVRADYFPFDHLPGGSLLVPESGVAYHSLRVAGFSRTLSR